MCIRDRAYENITEPPEFGCLIYGLFLDGGRWNSVDGVLDEQEPKILHYTVPVIRLTPVEIEMKEKKHVYICPVYKTSVRWGVLTTWLLYKSPSPRDS